VWREDGGINYTGVGIVAAQVVGFNAIMFGRYSSQVKSSVKNNGEKPSMLKQMFQRLGSRIVVAHAKDVKASPDGTEVSIYKAYDIRGRVPEEIDPELAEKIAAAFVDELGARTVVLGHDMRTHSESFSEACRRGITSRGADVVDVGLVTTPMVYFGTAHLGADAGIMVTASHNPAEYNGFKLCSAGAAPVSGDKGIPEIAARVERGGAPPSDRAGEVRTHDLIDDYREHVRSFLQSPLRELRVAMDAANGMAGHVIPSLFEGLPVRIVPLYFDLDGTFPNHEANPLKEENLRDLREAVRREGADLGIAYDGDADRCVFVDETAAILPCDLVTALMARDILSREPGAVVYDLRSSRVVPEEIRSAGGTAIRERVGHSLIKARMRAENAVFAGELSGHYYFRGNHFCDSAVVATFHLLDLLSRSGESLSSLIAPLRRYHATGEVNFVVEDKDAKIREIIGRFGDAEVDTLDGVTVAYPDWWFNVRKSNTEPLLRLNLEADTPEKMESGRRRVVDLLGTPT